MQSPSDRKNDRLKIAPILFGIPFFVVLTHVVFHRTLKDIAVHSAYIAISLFIVICILQLHGELESNGKVRWEKLLTSLADILPIMCLLGVAYYTIVVAIRDAYDYLLSPASGETPAILVTVIFTFCSGIALFIFRLKSRVLYGLTEIIVGVTVAAYRVTTTIGGEGFGPNLYVAVLTAGVYLVVRGLDNIHQGIKSQPTNKFTKIITSGHVKKRGSVASQSE